MFCFVYHRQSHFVGPKKEGAIQIPSTISNNVRYVWRIYWSQKRRVRYRYSPRFSNMHVILGVPLPSLRKRRCERRISPCPGSFSKFKVFFRFSQLFCFVHHRQSLFWGFRCLRLVNDVASAKSHRAPGPFAILMVFEICAIVFCFAYYRQSHFFGPKKESLIQMPPPSLFDNARIVPTATHRKNFAKFRTDGRHSFFSV